MELYKIIAFGIISAIVIVYLKSINSELSILASICAGVILVIMTVSYITEFVGLFSSIVDVSGISPSIFTLTVKIIAISYLVEFSATLIDDFGLKSISDKVVFAGRIFILTMAMPIIKNLVDLVVKML